jgi:hypothetical protein
MSATIDPLIAILDRIKEKALAHARRPSANVKTPRKAPHPPAPVGNGRRRRVRSDRVH